MKRFLKSMFGVTLLEIMLVLAIASMVIVMSIRYYQSATSSQQANSALSMIQSITAAADSMAQGSGGYTSAGVSASTILPLLPKNGLTTPWNTSATVTATNATAYAVTLPGTPAGVCPVLLNRLKGNSRYSVTSSCGSSAATFSYSYISS